ncbi:MAG: hypothetical protein R6X13_01600 [bacterium]
MLTALLALSLLAAPDIGVDSITEPDASEESGTTIIPAALISNSGDSAGSFGAWFVITSYGSVLYRESLAVAALEPDGDTTLFFPGFFVPYSEDTLTAHCWVAAIGDSNPQNDTARLGVSPYPHLP